MRLHLDKPDSYRVSFLNLDWSPICSFCVHITGKLRCKAFGDQPIPDDIWVGRDDHTSPRPGDHGLRFELSPDAEYDPREA